MNTTQKEFKFQTNSNNYRHIGGDMLVASPTEPKRAVPWKLVIMFWHPTRREEKLAHTQLLQYGRMK